jgi:beta-1,4-N-acetylglucosaminyltransferase
MILVTVGTHHQNFERLIRAMDEVAAELTEPVIIQIGHSTYTPHHAEHFEFTSGSQMEQLTCAARIVVAHAAAGTVIIALRQGKPLIVVPRLQRYGEVVDDHQLQLAAALAATGQAINVTEPTIAVLRAAIEQATRQQGVNPGTTQLIQAVSGQLRQWVEEI